MKSFRLTLPFALFILISSMVFGAARCPGNVAPVQYHSLPYSHIGISVTLNGSGPYQFMVDTGAEITVIEPALAKELKLEASGSINIFTVASRVQVPLVSADIVEVGPVSIRQMQMAVEDLGLIKAVNRDLRGILGNNFLGRFDLLIDNRQRTLCFDDSRRMQSSLSGERVSVVSNPVPGSPSAPPILLIAHLPDDGREGSVLRLDSGANVPLLYVDSHARATSIVQASAMSISPTLPVHAITIGKQAQFSYSYTPPRNVRFGAHTLVQITFAAKMGSSRLYSREGENGVLPTAVFKRVFISAADHFVIFDPR